MHEASVQNEIGRTITGKSRILLVDDHPLVRRGLKSLLDHETDLVVCGEAATETEALRALAATRPDIVVMDVALGSTNGIELTRTMRGVEPGVPILVLSLYEKMSYMRRALDAGACGFVTKTDTPENILAAIRLALTGQSPRRLAS